MSISRPACESTELSDDLFTDETKRCAAALGKKLERGYEERGEQPDEIC